MHFCDGTEDTVQYFLVLDAINFCFWPDDELEYEDLAKGLKAAILDDRHCLSASALEHMTGTRLRGLLGWPRPLPLESERARLLNEVGRELRIAFGGRAANLVRAAEGYACRLVKLLTAHFPGFRDQAVYGGRQVFLYKRAQILCGDLWGAFGGQGYGKFYDIKSLTMFADYRVPVVLKEMGLLVYSEELSAHVAERREIAAGSEWEVEIRAASVMAVEQLRLAIFKGIRDVKEKEKTFLAPVQLDWWLWGAGEAVRATAPPHHRTLSIFY